MEKLDNEEIYHLMDLLVMNTNNTLKINIMSDEQKKESISYDTNLISKLDNMIEQEDNTTPNLFEQ